MRFVIAAVALFLLSSFTQAELETAKNTKEFFKDGYWKCLATEVVRLVPTNMSLQEFTTFTKGACRKEQNDFFVSLLKYVQMLHPDLDWNAAATAANVAVAAAQTDAVTVFKDLRSGKTK